MLKDLLRGKARDITPKNRSTCFDSMGNNGGGYILKLTADDVREEATIQISRECDDMLKALEKGENVRIMIPKNVLGAPYNTIATILAWRVEEYCVNVDFVLNGAVVNAYFNNCTYKPTM